MKLRHILGGCLGLTLLAIWGVMHMTISYVLTGECFPND